MGLEGSWGCFRNKIQRSGSQAQERCLLTGIAWEEPWRHDLRFSGVAFVLSSFLIQPTFAKAGEASRSAEACKLPI